MVWYRYGDPTSRRRGKNDNKTKKPEYNTWASMKQRCGDPKASRYSRYGGRGIRVCSRWLHPINGFNNFIDDVGKRPSPQHSIDRIDNNGDYKPGNVRWATVKEQSRNKSRTRIYTFEGKTMCLADWAESLNVTPAALYRRLKNYGWSVERTLSNGESRTK